MFSLPEVLIVLCKTNAKRLSLSDLPTTVILLSKPCATPRNLIQKRLRPGLGISGRALPVP